MRAFSVVLITPAHSPEQPTVVYSLPLQGGCGGPASITSTTPRPSARSSTSPPPVALVAHHRRHTGRIAAAGSPDRGGPSWAGCAAARAVSAPGRGRRGRGRAGPPTL